MLLFNITTYHLRGLLVTIITIPTDIRKIEYITPLPNIILINPISI
ncbi:hypothetical protein B6U43_08965 [Ligilactobacillus salivarius]|uniref:Uncharacterized protein n=1 Tax=Ligilactobacillus salivarius TaxID=1624 RepID=A0AB36MIE8_9LACO|nr:hypothetical protein B6U43_08965 [Ligilactobacillus salivarius]OUN18815.1 hypothetical protein B5G36_04075 [Ligilactobacillus salivarius]